MMNWNGSKTLINKTKKNYKSEAENAVQQATSFYDSEVAKYENE